MIVPALDISKSDTGKWNNFLSPTYKWNLRNVAQRTVSELLPKSTGNLSFRWDLPSDLDLLDLLGRSVHVQSHNHLLFHFSFFDIFFSFVRPTMIRKDTRIDYSSFSGELLQGNCER